MTDRVLITGSTGGLGEALIEVFQGPHADLALHYRQDESKAAILVAAAQKAGSRAAAFQQDFSLTTTDHEVAHFLARVHNEIGAPNIAVLNAANQEVTPWDELEAANWDEMYAANFRSPALMIGQLAKTMSQLTLENRVIVLIGSIEGLRPAKGHAPYATMKAALHHLVAAAAAEVGPLGVRVVGVAPGLIDREGLAEDWPDGVSRWKAAVALGRSIQASEVAKAVRWLASSDASAITGVVLPVDAGWSANAGW